MATVSRRFVLGIVMLALMGGPFVESAFAQEEPPGVVFMLRRSDRGTDYRAFDVVQVFDAFRADGTVRTFVLPPADPFAFVKVHGITLEEALPFMEVEYNPDGTIANKRRWGIRTQSVPASVRQFFLANWFVGFGSAADQALYVPLGVPNIQNDVVLQWSEVQTWLRQKGGGGGQP